MTENEKLVKDEIEAIECLKSNKPTSGYLMLQEAIDMAIKALEEVQQYREIGTEEVCRMAVRKQKARRALHQGCYDKNGTWHEWNGVNGKPYELCPSCGANLCCEMSNDKKPEYCVDCGQKLYWGEADAEH